MKIVRIIATDGKEAVRSDPPQLADTPWRSVLQTAVAKDLEQRFDSVLNTWLRRPMVLDRETDAVRSKGQSLPEQAEAERVVEVPEPAGEVVRPLDAPLSTRPTINIVRGSLLPGGGRINLTLRVVRL